MPIIFKGRLWLFVLKLTPNCSNGVVILWKSLFERLLSPTNLITLGDFTNNPSINLAKVPELPASIEIFFL